MLKRSAGVLLNISSLPSAYGIGGFGKEIEDGCKFLISGGFTYWQVLPLTMIGQGNSPYSGNSAFALNYLYVDPDELVKDGYVTDTDLLDAISYCSPYMVNYNEVKQKKEAILRRAYANKKECLVKELKDYCNNNPWVKDYAMYKTLKSKFQDKSWLEWPNEFKFKENINIYSFTIDNKEDFYYYVFEQYVLSFQWEKAKNICKKYGIGIIGDMPMYVSLDSSDVWANRQYFQLDEKGKPKKVAGVPPDYFSENGQLWGNPLYSYKTMAKDGFKWWMDRIDRMMSLYDILRIDHFRAFSDYWAVPIEAETAKEGKWCKGVGMDLFELIFKKYSKDRFIAEDLGIIDDRVVKLLKATRLPGMRVMHFGFDEEDNMHKPCNYTKNCIGYTATHDNNTSLGWLFELDETRRDRVLKYINCDKAIWGRGAFDTVSVKLMIKKLMESDCTLGVVPLQDLFGFGSDCRMNTPGIAEGNWTYRATKDQFASCRVNYFVDLNKATGRYR